LQRLLEYLLRDFLTTKHLPATPVSWLAWRAGEESEDELSEKYNVDYTILNNFVIFVSSW